MGAAGGAPFSTSCCCCSLPPPLGGLLVTPTLVVLGRLPALDPAVATESEAATGVSGREAGVEDGGVGVGGGGGGGDGTVITHWPMLVRKEVRSAANTGRSHAGICTVPRL